MVDVDVLDLNDNPPVFVNKPYYAIVSKQAAVDSKVIQVMAVDADKGSNADIYYQLVRGNGELFRVERKSGYISLRRQLESYRKDYILTIAATTEALLRTRRRSRYRSRWWTGLSQPSVSRASRPVSVRTPRHSPR